ncbi:recombinase family protein [Prauserella endophytica]|uniref:Recombinase family protein n=3 Tax=Pseudonocardiaceae TaxID=2070 RepID=A0ABY2S0W3_9PSEU|nr:recombinase family protein [Prauserella endophytica]
MARSTTAQRSKKAAMTTLGDDVRVGIYVRRSTDDEHQPYSIEAQDTRLDAYIGSQPGWRLVARFPDDASGATTERDGLQRALAAARAGLIDVLLVYRVDRFSRNLRDMVMLLDELDSAGVVFRSATEPFDTSTPMGRMLVQMLGMFAQFERDTIIDRVIAGMERKHAKGKWKGGKRPFGYLVDKTTHTLVVDEHEAVIVRLIFDLYTKDRLGSRAIAKVLNDRGHRTSSGGKWSGYQVIRALNNRVYLGELTFRETTVTDTHAPIIDLTAWEQAQAILDARGESHAHRAASGSDYVLTGRLRCPKCRKAMIGTRATGRNRTYRYYTCWNLARYDASKCDFKRLNADAVDVAVLDALAGFYRTRHDLIADAIAHEQTQHQAANADRNAELATVENEITKTGQAIDRYLTAFERGTMDEELVADRLTELRAKTKQLRVRRDELTLALDDAPTAPEPATLVAVADHIAEIITSGSHNQIKGLVEALVAKVTITGPDRLIPVFRIPQPRNNDGTAPALPAETAPKGVVRTMTKSVGPVGLEPTLART